MADTLEAGWSQLRAGNPAGAVRVAKSALMDDPNDINALSLLSSSQLAQGDFRLARDTVQQWLRIAPDDPLAHEVMFRAYVASGRQTDAEQTLSHFTASFPHLPTDIALMRSIFDMAFGRPARAAETLRDMLETNGADPSLMTLAAMAEHRAKNAARAGALVDAAIEAAPNDPNLLRLKAATDFRLFRWPDARRAAAEALRLDPADSQRMRYIAPLTRLALFPPFLVGHAIQWIMTQAAGRFGGWAGHSLAALAVAFCAGLIIRQREQPPPKTLADVNPAVGLLFVFGWAIATYYWDATKIDQDVRRRRLAMPHY